eukprot:IDg2315t1
MPLGRQSDHSLSHSAAWHEVWRALLPVIARRRKTHSTSMSDSSTALLPFAFKYIFETEEIERYELRKREVSTACSASNFESFTDASCLALFRFQKRDVLRFDTSLTVGRTAFVRHLVTAIHAIHSWLHALSCVVSHRQLDGLTLRSYSKALLAAFRAGLSTEQYWAFAPRDYAEQNVMYNDHKRKHALKYQVVTAPDRLILHAAGPLEGRKHDWTLYLRSGLDEELASLLFISESTQKAFSKEMSAARVTVEWYFKEVKLYWTTVDFKKKLRISESPYFNCHPPSIEEYLAHKNNS